MYDPYGYGYSYHPPGWSGSPYNSHWNKPPNHLRDYGPNPFTINIEEATLRNRNFRTALWTGKHLQLTLMSLNPGEDIGLEMHPDVDQFIRIEQGQGLVMMGDTSKHLGYQQRVSDNYVILIPAGKWHNVVNTGRTPLKLYSIYAPPEHPRGTVHRTKRDAEKHHNHGYYNYYGY